MSGKGYVDRRNVAPLAAGRSRSVAGTFASAPGNSRAGRYLPYLASRYLVPTLPYLYTSRTSDGMVTGGQEPGAGRRTSTAGLLGAAGPGSRDREAATVLLYCTSTRSKYSV